MITLKICGLTTLDDALWALEQGADYLGFVLYPESPRHVTLREFVRLKRALPETARCVAVFVNEEHSHTPGGFRQGLLQADKLLEGHVAVSYTHLTLPTKRIV